MSIVAFSGAGGGGAEDGSDGAAAAKPASNRVSTRSLTNNNNEPTTVLSLHRKEFNRLLGGLKERILHSWVKERKNSMHGVAPITRSGSPSSPDDVVDGDKGDEGHEGHEGHEGEEEEEVEVEEEEETKTSKMSRPSSVDLAHRKLAQSVVLGHLSVEDSLVDADGLGAEAGAAPLSDDDMDDLEEEDDDDEMEEEEDEEEDEYDSSGELDLDWNDCKVLDATIQFEDLEPRAQLGAGSFGSVHLVLHKTTQRHYALKLMSRVYIVDNGWEEMVEHERHAMLELAGTSKFLIDLYNTYTDLHYIYMLMELCTGGELYEYLCKQENKSISVGGMRFCKFFFFFFIFFSSFSFLLLFYIYVVIFSSVPLTHFDLYISSCFPPVSLLFPHFFSFYFSPLFSFSPLF